MQRRYSRIIRLQKYNIFSKLTNILDILSQKFDKIGKKPLPNQAPFGKIKHLIFNIFIHLK